MPEVTRSLFLFCFACLNPPYFCYLGRGRLLVPLKCRPVQIPSRFPPPLVIGSDNGEDIVIFGSVGIGGEIGGILDVFPNPFSDNFFISISDDIIGEIVITLQDLLGRIRKQHTVSGINLYEVDTSDLEFGVYFLRIEFSSEIFHLLLLKSPF